MEKSGLDALWQALSADLAPDAQRMLIRLIKAHVQFLAEIVRVAEKAG